MKETRKISLNSEMDFIENVYKEILNCKKPKKVVNEMNKRRKESLQRTVEE